MVTIVDGREVIATLKRAIRTPECYRDVIVCSPFIEGRGLALLDELHRLRTRHMPRILVMSTPEIIRKLLQPRWEKRVGFTLKPVRHLHAKVYAIYGHRVADHQAVITSANLTGPGLKQNVEVGVRLTGSDAGHVRLIERLPSRVRNIYL